ncbi:MAG: DUF2971 domain-containing protein [Terricaulis sp.]
MRAYYFTSLAHGLSNIALQRLKISRVHELNDPYELFAADLSEETLRTPYESMRAQLAKTRGMLCFSKSWEKPLMWSHYADRHRGVCLGCDIPDDAVFEVRYSEERVPFTRELLSHKDPEEWMKRYLGTKHAAWAEEREVRVICDLDPATVEDGLFFYELDDRIALREVILGVRCSLPKARVERLTEQMGASVSVRTTQLSNSAFAVLAAET